MPSIPEALAKIVMRNATPKDIPAIRALFERAYAGSGVSSYSAAMLRGQINKFAEGQFVADYAGASSASAPAS
jgi:predicted N-acetyltransferase YhbS